MNLKVYKDKRNTGKHHHKVPHNTNCTATKHAALREISKYIAENSDFGEHNYLNCEYLITTKLNPYNTYVYEDLLQVINI